MTIVKLDKNKVNIIAEAKIDRIAEKVWGKLKQIENIHEFHPLVKDSYIISENQYGIHTKRKCKLIPFGEMDEIVTSWNDGQSFSTEVIGGKFLPPYKFITGKISLNKKNETTLVSFELSYQLKYGFIGKIIDIIFIRPQFKKSPIKYVNGLKEYIERN